MVGKSASCRRTAARRRSRAGPSSRRDRGTDQPHRQVPLPRVVLGAANSGVVPLHAAGGALRCYHTVKGLLSRELGIDPGTELALLYQRILMADPSLMTTK